MNKAASIRTILRASAIMGMASVAHILFGMIRIKAAAVLLGPAGVGLIGLMQSLMTTAAIVATCGIDTVSTRQIATAVEQDRQADVNLARRVLLWAGVALALTGGSVFLLLRQVLATHILADPDMAVTVGWLTVGVVFAVAASAQVALLNGLRRIRSLALLKAVTGLVATTIGVVALLLWGGGGVLLFVIALPLANLAVGQVLISRLETSATGPLIPRGIARQIGGLAWFGAPFMLGSMITIAGQLVVRSVVQHDLGPAALGQFEASWMISMTYLGFVLGAMATDYFPRLSGQIDNKPAATRLVNEQTEVALILVGPVLILLMGFAPWVIQLLYSPEFADAAAILRWQILGDLLKVMSWPVAFVMLAAGKSRTFLLTELCGTAVFIVAAIVIVPQLGLVGTGIGFLMMYVCYLPIVFLVAWRTIGFTWSQTNRLRLLLLAVSLLLIFAAATWSGAPGTVLSMLLAAAFALQGYRHLRRISRQPQDLQ